MLNYNYSRIVNILSECFGIALMIIGVTGLYGTGKDTVAQLLVEKNFFHISLSDMLREELKGRNMPLTRDNLIDIGNELRQKFGYSVLAEKALAKVKDGENFVITSIRNPDEAALILQEVDSILVNVTTPIDTRLARIIERDRAGDPKTIEELNEKEKKEMSDDPSAQQLHRVMKLAKITLKNDRGMGELRKKTDKLVKDYLYKLQPSRPSWDEYFMDVAEKIKLRSTCLSARKGSVLIKGNRIISTGYNGSPRGIKHCNDGGCVRCTQRHLGKIKSGVYSEPCICCHSEENAIVQAAVHGISTEGSKLYTTFTPCVNCAKLIINAGIKEVIGKTVYPDDVGMSLLKEGGVKFRLFK